MSEKDKSQYSSISVAQYAKRIEYQGALKVGYACLSTLHRCHVMTIPFEALDVQLNRKISLELHDVYTKVVSKKRGGFCYELNYLFYSFLSKIGFNCFMVSSKIFDDVAYGPDFDHMSVIVRLEEDWLVDVGFGDLFIEPIKVHVMDIQPDQFKKYKIVQKENDQYLLTESLKDKNDFKKKYIFDLTKRSIVEFADQCYYKQYAPESYFVKNRVCTLPTEFGRKTIMNDLFKVKYKGEVQETIIKDDAQYIELLHSEFGITL